MERKDKILIGLLIFFLTLNMHMIPDEEKHGIFYWSTALIVIIIIIILIKRGNRG